VAEYLAAAAPAETAGGEEGGAAEAAAEGGGRPEPLEPLREGFASQTASAHAAAARPFGFRGPRGDAPTARSRDVQKPCLAWGIGAKTMACCDSGMWGDLVRGSGMGCGPGWTEMLTLLVCVGGLV
jgi:hypothetical protein